MVAVASKAGVVAESFAVAWCAGTYAMLRSHTLESVQELEPHMLAMFNLPTSLYTTLGCRVVPADVGTPDLR